MPLCGNEQLRQLWLEDISDLDGVGDGEVLWRLRAEGSGSGMSKVSFGETPAGFLSTGLTSLPELADQFGDRSLRVNAETDRSSRLVGTFTIAALPTDGSAVLFDAGDDKVLGVDELVADQRDECSDGSLPVNGVAAGAAAAGIAIVVVGGVMWRQRYRRAPDSV